MTRTAEVLDWLAEEWSYGSPIAIVEGFPGIGKSDAVRRFARTWDGPSVTITPSVGLPYEDLLLEIVAKLEQVGITGVADADDWEAAFLDRLRPSDLLVIIDDFDALLSSDGTVTSREVARLLGLISREPGARVCLVSSHSPAPDRWNSNARIRTMRSPDLAEGAALLARLLRERGMEDELGRSEVSEVSKWLGSNPRALRAFVACLMGETLPEIISRDPESWELRETPPSRALMQQLEEQFWASTIGRLDSESLALAENLSVFRRPFRVEAIQSAGATNPQWEASRNTLSRSFLLEKSQTSYALNPIVRKLCLSSIARNSRRLRAAHARAAEFFLRRLSPEVYRDAARSGAAFVEARYHLGEEGRRDRMEAIAREYRAVLVRAIRNVDFLHGSNALERVPVLLAALAGENSGHSHLRSALVQLLERRGREGDLVTALQHARIAAHETSSPSFWMAYLRIVTALGSDETIVTVAEQALTRCEPEPERVVVKAAEALHLRGSSALAITMLDRAIGTVGGDAVIYLTRIKAFILERSGSPTAAFALMTDTHAEQAGGRVADMLLEEACFFAYQHGRSDWLEFLVTYALDHAPLSREIDRLAEMLRAMLDEDFGRALSVASAPFGGALAFQVAFCRLAMGDPEGASEALPSGSVSNSPANRWLEAVVALAVGDADTYIRSITEASTRVLSDEDLADALLWLRVWDEHPVDLRPYPSYYYPRLPPSITGLEVTLVRNVVTGSQAFRIAEARPLQRITRPVAGPVEGAPSVVSTGGASPAIHIEGNQINVGTNYNNYGQAGAFGESAAVHGDVNQSQGTPTVSDALRELLSEARASADVDVVGALEAALAYRESGDNESARSRLAAVAGWIADKLTDGTVAVAAGLVLAAFGLS